MLAVDTDDAEACYEECKSTTGCVAFAYETGKSSPFKDCDLYEDGPYTTGNGRDDTTCYVVPKCKCEHDSQRAPNNGIVCGYDVDGYGFERVEYCTSWEFCTGGVESSGAVLQHTKRDLCTTQKCYCENENGSTPNNGIMCGLDDDYQRVCYCAATQSCTGTTSSTDGVEYLSRADLCTEN